MSWYRSYSSAIQTYLERSRKDTEQSDKAGYRQKSENQTMETSLKRKIYGLPEGQVPSDCGPTELQLLFVGSTRQLLLQYLHCTSFSGKDGQMQGGRK